MAPRGPGTFPAFFLAQFSFRLFFLLGVSSLIKICFLPSLFTGSQQIPPVPRTLKFITENTSLTVGSAGKDKSPTDKNLSLVKAAPLCLCLLCPVKELSAVLKAKNHSLGIKSVCRENSSLCSGGCWQDVAGQADPWLARLPTFHQVTQG